MRDADIATALERWRVTNEPRDWAAVLARAGHIEPSSSSPLRRAVLIAALATAVLVVAPASALVAHLRGDGGPSALPGLTVVARFPTSSPVSGRVTLRASRLFVVITRKNNVKPRIFGPVRAVWSGRLRVRWTLRLDPRGARVLSARIRAGSQVVATLCAPCSPRASGVIRLTRRQLVPVFAGRTRIELRTDEGVARERLLLRTPRR
jgi:hypothetical protein